MSIARLIQRIKKFFIDLAKINSAPMMCRIDAEFKDKYNHHYYSVCAGRTGFNIKLSAHDIIKSNLISCFENEDRAKIIIASGLCKYQLQDYIYDADDDEYIFTINAIYNDITYKKKFSLSEIVQHQLLLDEIPDRQRKIILNLININKVIPISNFTQLKKCSEH